MPLLFFLLRIRVCLNVGWYKTKYNYVSVQYNQNLYSFGSINAYRLHIIETRLKTVSMDNFIVKKIYHLRK